MYCLCVTGLIGGDVVLISGGGDDECIVCWCVIGFGGDECIVCVLQGLHRW